MEGDDELLNVNYCAHCDERRQAQKNLEITFNDLKFRTKNEQFFLSPPLKQKNIHSKKRGQVVIELLKAVDI